MHGHKFGLAIRDLAKAFERPAVTGLDLTVRAGEFYALLGPNGAGKTTTLRMVVGLLRPDAARSRVAGIDALADPVAAKQITAWISDEPMIYDKLTPLEYLAFVAGLWGIDPALAQTRAHDLIDWLDLAPHAHERCEGFSKGMRQKVALAGALVHDPQVIILDEPLTGLDAGSARQVKSVLRERVNAGGTVIMSTHILEVAERMADRIGVIAEGRLIAEGTLDELRIKAGKVPAAPRAWRIPSSRWSPSRRRRRSFSPPLAGEMASEAKPEGACAVTLAQALMLQTPSLPSPASGGGKKIAGVRTDAMTHPGTLAWFAQHESRLAWRDWLSMITAGRRERMRTVAVAIVAFAIFMHFVAYSMVGRYRRRRCRQADAGGRHRQRAAVTGR